MSDISLPPHLTVDLLKNALKNALLVQNVEIINFEASLATQSGDNYTSDIYRVIVNYKIQNSEVKKIALIVKYMLKPLNISEEFEEYKLFEKEGFFYSNLLPKLTHHAEIEFGPKCYNIYNFESKIFVMEDLRESGYAVADRLIGLDLEKCLLVAKKLGSFHAASMIHLSQNPIIEESLKFGLFKRRNGKVNKDSFIVELFTKSLSALIDEMSSWPGFEEIVVKLGK